MRRVAVVMLLGVALAAGAGVPGEQAPGEQAPDLVVAGDWSWPLDEPRVLARPFLAPATPYGSGHRGVDLGFEPGAGAGAESGIPVYAPADGVIHFSGVVVDRPVLSIDHGGGVISSFEPVTTELAAGEPVTRGERIGTLEPGHCAATCLHFGVRENGGYVNPLLYLGGIPRSILLPTRR